jgi:AAHS family 4-hydroxybenzoate transporter-like MFS transporter
MDTPVASKDRFAAPIDLGHALDFAPWSAFQKRVLALAALAFSVDGLANQVLGLAIPSLVRDWGASREAFAPVAAFGLIGVALGAALGGVIGDRLGRRAGLIASVFLFGLMTCLTANAHGVGGLASMRLIAGLGIGGAIPSGAALITEFTPLHRRSLAVALGMVFIPVGGLLAGVIGAYLLPTFGWRGLFLAAGLLPLVLAIALVFVLPESPRILSRLQSNHTKLILLLRRCGRHFEADAVFAQDRYGAEAGRIGLLFDKSLLANTLPLWCGFFFCLLASYTIFSWVPTMLAGQGFTLSMTSRGMAAFNLGGVVGGVAGGYLVGKWGSRAPVIGLALGAIAGALALGLLPLDPLNGLLRVMVTLVLEGCFIAGLHNVLYTLATHIYPSYVRATGVGAASAVGRIGAILSSFTGVLTLELGGASSYFITIAGAVTLSLVGVTLVRDHIPRIQSEKSTA